MCIKNIIVFGLCEDSTPSKDHGWKTIVRALPGILINMQITRAAHILSLGYLWYNIQR